jgi:hypothetical protein
MSIVIEAATKGGEVQKTSLVENVSRIAVQPGTAYRLVGTESTSVGSKPVAKRIGDDMVIEGLADGKSVVFEGFYTACADGDSCSVAFAQDGDTPAAILLPSSAPLATLSDGSLLMYPAGGSEAAAAVAATAAAGTAAAAASGGVLMPTLAALGGLAVAAGGGGGGGDGGSTNNDPQPEPEPEPQPEPEPEPQADTTAPGAPTIDALAPTNSTAPEITGTAEPFSTVKVLIDGQFAGTAETDGSGNWSFTPNPALTEGSYSITATATDAAGNESDPSTATSLVIDTSVPSVSIDTTIAGDNRVNLLESQSGVTVSGTAEAGATVTVVWGEVTKTVVATGGTWSAFFDSDELPDDGTTQISATATDAAGNTSDPATRSVEIDKAAPSVSIDATIAGDNRVNLAESQSGVTVSGTAEAGATVTVVWGEVTKTVVATGGTWSAFFDSDELPDDGTTQISATAADAAGNTSDPASRTVEIDTTNPAAPTVNLVGLTNDSTPTVTGTATLGAGETLSVNVGGVDYTLGNGLTIDGSGNWSLTSGFLTDGSYNVIASVIDAAGNTSTDSTTNEVTIDTTPPDYNWDAGYTGIYTRHGSGT